MSQAILQLQIGGYALLYPPLIPKYFHDKLHFFQGEIPILDFAIGKLLHII
jgi:hypothetical protein